MPVVMVDLIFASAMAAVGVALGWWLRGGQPGTGESGEESRRAHEVLSRLHDLAARVAADVGEHSSRVEEINEELASTGIPDTEAVVSAVDKLVEANGRMQQQLHSAEERLKQQARQIESATTEARTDVLTGLANRRALDDMTARCLAEFEKSGKTFSTVMIDVDHFKKFNDAHGHQAGDEVLRRVGKVLRQNTRSGAMAARYGGEEFAVILPGVPAADAALEDAERIRKAIDAARFRFMGADLHVTVSTGAADLMGGEDVATMIKRADASLYASKEAGRNCTHWHDGARCWPVAPKTEPDPREKGPRSTAPNEAAQPTAPQSSQASSPAAPTAPQPAPPAPAQGSAHARHESQPTLCDGNTFCTVLGNRLAEWRRGGLPPSLLLIHIDRYESIVSSHGAAVGNRVFRITTQFLQAAIRDMDLVAQYEDVTFALLLPGAGLSNAVGVAERLRAAIGRCSIPIGQGRVQFTVSVGGAEASGGDDTPKLIQRAQEALTSAIQSGGDCGYFHNGQWSETVKATLGRCGSAKAMAAIDETPSPLR